MAILDIQHNRQGIQTLDFQLTDPDAFPGQTAVLVHSNGNVYVVFALNYNLGVSERRLFFAKSTDRGATWSARSQLTSGHWDDQPAIIQIDPTDVNSEIGVVFTRSVSWYAGSSAPDSCYLYRFTLDTNGSITSPVDYVTNGGSNPRYINLVRSDTKYIIAYIDHYASTYIYLLENPIVPANPHRGFTDNAWASRNVYDVGGDSTKYIDYLSVRKLSDGHFAALMSIRTGNNGYATSDGAGCTRSDLAVRFSSDNLYTFGPVQQLTNYADYIGFDLQNSNSSGACDLAQLSDGTIAVFFSEYVANQAMTANTTPVFNASFPLECLYISRFNYAVLAGYYLASGSYWGIWIVDLTNHSVTRITTSSTPPIWSERINRIAISSDEQYLAVATESSLEIINLVSSEITSWTATSLRTTTSPALRDGDIEWCAFDGTTTLFFAYAGSGTTRLWGGKIDVTNLAAGITDLWWDSSISYAGGISDKQAVIIRPDKLVSAIYSRICATGKDGTALYSTDVGGNNTVAYDDVNDEYVVGYSNGMKRVKDTGSGFNILESFSKNNTDPDITNPPFGATSLNTVPGCGCYSVYSGYGSAYVSMYYCFARRKPTGTMYPSPQQQHETFCKMFRFSIHVMKDGNWLGGAETESAAMLAINVKKRGRIRWAQFHYDENSKQLLTTGVDFYDASNIAKLGDDASLVPRFHVAATDLDRIVVIGEYHGYSRPTRQFAVFISYIEPDAQKLTARARIMRNPSCFLDGLARVRSTSSRSLDMRMRIAFAQCIKAKAKIVPRTTKTFTARAAIKGPKKTNSTFYFDVQAVNRRKALRVQFWAYTGRIDTNSLTARAYIVPLRQFRTTGHFLVTITPGGSGSLTWTSASSKRAFLAVGARVQK